MADSAPYCLLKIYQTETIPAKIIAPNFKMNIKFFRFVRLVKNRLVRGNFSENFCQNGLRNFRRKEAADFLIEAKNRLILAKDLFFIYNIVSFFEF